jgi:peptide/nickel transport system permease protein
MKYALGRVLHGLLLLAVVSFVAFSFAQLAPGDYYSDLRVDPNIAPATIERMREDAGLRRPFLSRYASWVASVARGDFGYSLTYSGPVAPLLRERTLATLLLDGFATAAAWLLAVPIGIWIAARRGRWPDAMSKVVLSAMLIVPDLLLAIGALMLAVETGWFPVGGMASGGGPPPGASERARDLLWHLALPAAVLVVGMLPVLVRHVRAAMVEVLDSPFALSARAHGIPSRRRMFRWLLPAAANPLVGLFGLSLGSLLSASLLIEVAMGWPGMGPLLVDAILSRDIAIVLGVVMLSAAFLIAGNLVADLLLYRLDPRIRVR